MAWFQDLAVKAEGLLVKFDQNAANVFSESNSIKLGSSKSANIIDQHQENNSLMSDIRINVESKEAPLQTIKHSNSFSEFYNVNTFNDNVSISGEGYAGLSDDDNGISFHAMCNSDKEDASSLAASESIRESKSESLQNSFVLMDDPIVKYEEKLRTLERENCDINQQLIELRHLYSEIQNENSSLRNNLERTNESLAETQQEMEKYRIRAQRVLQEKEKLITLKGSNSHLQDSSANTLLATYNEELKKELAFQEEKYNQLSEKFSKVNNELLTLQYNFLTTQNDNENLKQSFQDVLTNERKIRAAIEEEYHLKTKELQSALHDLAQKNSIIANKSQEVIHIKEQLKQKINSTVNDNLESRLHALTQTLLSKQNTLETITTERNALRFQLEKLENEHHKVILQMQKNSKRGTAFVEPIDVRTQVPHFMKVSPFDAEVTRKVKHAYSTLDALGIRTSLFLRRYPFARVFLLFYMVLLHILVLLILCTYVP